MKRRLIFASLMLVVLVNKDAMEKMPKYKTVPATMIKKNQSTIYNISQKSILNKLRVEMRIVEISNAFSCSFEKIHSTLEGIFKYISSSYNHL